MESLGSSSELGSSSDFAPVETEVIVIGEVSRVGRPAHRESVEVSPLVS